MRRCEEKKVGRSVEQLVARGVRLTDIAVLFEWANDPQTRHSSFNRGRIGPLEHLLWFLRVALPNRSRHIVVEALVDKQKTSILFCRFVQRNERATISINMAPKCRGKGLAKPALETAIPMFISAHPAVRVIDACVRNLNEPSLRLFRSLRFSSAGSSGETSRFELQVESFRI